MSPQVAWQGEALSDQAEDELVSYLRQQREARAQALLAVLERQQQEHRLFEWICRAVALSMVVSLVGPFLVGLGWLLRRLLG